jgi:hypothetical protein
MTMKRFIVAALVSILVVSIMTPARAVAAAFRLLVIGDSIPYDDGNYRSAAALHQLMLDNGIPNTVEVEAFPGKPCLYLAERIGEFLAAHNPDAVVVECGTNDLPSTMIYGEVSTGWAIRTIVETTHNYRPANPIKVVPSMVGYSDHFIWPSLAEREYQINGIFWSTYGRYAPGWLTGWADFQNVPTDTALVDDTGVHYRKRGLEMRAAIVYRAMAPAYGWPQIQEPCGASGHPPNSQRKAYVDCPEWED